MGIEGRVLALLCPAIAAGFTLARGGKGGQNPGAMIPGSLPLAVVVHGPDDGVPVLAVHGWQDNAASFELLAPHLPGVRLVAVDLAGHGHSPPRPAGVPYRFLDWVVDVHDTLVRLGPGRAALLGHSLGAGIAAAVAAAWPELVDRLVLIDGFTPRTGEPDELPRRLAEYVRRRDELAARGRRAFADVDAAARRLTETLGLPLEAARPLAVRGTRPVPSGGVEWRRDPRILAGPPARLVPAQVRALLEAVRCPVLLLRPERGWPLPHGSLEAALRALRDVRLVRLPGGHHVHLERPAAVAEVIGPFLCDGARGPKTESSP